MKALEPLIALSLSLFIFRKWPPFDSSLAIVIVIGGAFCVCAGDTSISASAFIWILTSSFVTQIRNQLLKLQQRKTLRHSLTLDLELPPTPHHLALQGLFVFVAASAGAFLMSLPMILFDKSQRETCLDGLVIEAGMSHFLYNLASFGVLAIVSPATHSLANTAKRAVIVGCSTFFLREKITRETMIGLCLVLVGSLWYSTSTSELGCINNNTLRKGYFCRASILVAFLMAGPWFQHRLAIPSFLLSGAIRKDSFSSHCLYDRILYCLLRLSPVSNISDFNVTNIEGAIEGRIDTCVRQWNSSQQHEDTGMEWPPQSLQILGIGPGKGKDMIDWATYRLDVFNERNLNVKVACCASDKDALPSWGASLPIISRGYTHGGSYLPPWYAMGVDESALSFGYYLPQPPQRKSVSNHSLLGGFRTTTFTGVANLGDCFNYYLYGIVSGLKNFKGENRGPLFCQVGSILHQNCDVVWGSGLITDHKVVFSGKSVEVHATRGPDTLNRLKSFSSSPGMTFGDPGLLATLIFPISGTVESVDFCIIPHYIDHSNPTLNRLLKNGGNETEGYTLRFLNIETCSFDEFVENLSGCKRVLSSSLHGLIFAFSYGIPGIRLIFSDKVIGNHFKFRDFYNGIGHPDLYKFIEVKNGKKIPFSEIAQLIRLKVPSFDAEALWSSNPVHAQNLGIRRAEHLKRASSWTKNLHSVYPHKSYVALALHVK
eukprot:CAMPEP_0181028178 /NCGR_PEP_ID=MMETSP1070-20121207/4536_1 /TAXON_ID=265543 /ORGANISM="Minutocellus polymorphus, Strain NH13" /LENGTH=713 /DNA_ID=CAMNT_0023105423 /DNA_START=717 /DNA_END=2858 /DNA_ORIENTATION=+